MRVSTTESSSNIHSQTGVWEQGQSPVGCVSQRTIKKHMQIITSLPKGLTPIDTLSLSAKFSFYANLVLWCVGNSTLPKYENMPYLSQKLFLNVKIDKKL